MGRKPEDFVHPELKLGELLFTNASRQQFESMDWKTKRKGTVAYDGKGNKLHFKDWFPVFISSMELKEKKVSLQDVRRQWRASQGWA